MTYVVTDNCIKCKYTDCVEVCPVDCFYEGENMLVIHPDECIDCGVCVPECPAEAIFPDTDPSATHAWLALNHEFASVWPSITRKKPPPEDADDWNGVPGKFDAHSVASRKARNDCRFLAPGASGIAFARFRFARRQFLKQAMHNRKGTLHG